ncbi:MAG: helix-hairpin-helix domain-containing protein, partial [Planctomycetota bacterium]
MPEPLLRRSDQATIAAIVALALVGSLAWWLRAGGLTGGLIDLRTAPPREARFLVDVNRAEWPELAQLPGVGPTIAQRIVAERAAAGDYRTTEGLMRVRGVGPRKLEAMRPHLLPLPDDGQLA